MVDGQVAEKSQPGNLNTKAEQSLQSENNNRIGQSKNEEKPRKIEGRDRSKGSKQQKNRSSNQSRSKSNKAER